MNRLCFAFALPLIFTVACGEDAAPAPAFTGDLARCDITAPGCQRGIFESVAELLEVDGSDVPAIRTISVAQFEEEVRSSLSGDDLAGDDPESRGLRLIGFIPESSGSVTEDIVDARVQSVAAYYNSGNQAITVIDRDYDEIDGQTILAHEFVHAIQDRQFGISQAYSSADSTDGVMGARSVVEGDATYWSFVWVYEQLDIDPTSIDWDEIYKSFQRGSVEDAASPDASIVASASGFPYAYGIELLGRAADEQGLPSRGAFFAAPPPAAVDAMLGYESFIENGFVALTEPGTAFPAPTPESELAVEDRFGAWYLFATLLRAGVDPEAAFARAVDWRGDKLGIFEDGDEVVAVWRLRFEGGPSASLTTLAVNSSERGVSWSAVAEGSEVFVVAAESDPLLATWEAQPTDVIAAALASVTDARKSLNAGPPPGCAPPQLPTGH